MAKLNWAMFRLSKFWADVVEGLNFQRTVVVITEKQFGVFCHNTCHVPPSMQVFFTKRPGTFRRGEVRELREHVVTVQQCCKFSSRLLFEGVRCGDKHDIVCSVRCVRCVGHEGTGDALLWYMSTTRCRRGILTVQVFPRNVCVHSSSNKTGYAKSAAVNQAKGSDQRVCPSCHTGGVLWRRRGVVEDSCGRPHHQHQRRRCSPPSVF